MKPSLAKGTRDFSAQEVYRRRYIIGTLQRNFELCGFEPLETPSFENLQTLTGKYGEEGDRLIFKILNSGNYLEKIADEELGLKNTKSLTPQISDKALRYDLTVPFARFVAMNHGKLVFPFKRYQIQPVWRADRPQKGRFREFYQCDADIVGSTSLLQEVELVGLYHKAFQDLGLGITIRLNNRKILSGLAEYAGIGDKIIPFTVALDKLDKIGKEGVLQELQDNAISTDSLQKLDFLFDTSLSEADMLANLRNLFPTASVGAEGVQEVEFVLNTAREIHSDVALQLDITLARGIDYYTGSILEVVANDVALGSIGGGGRYDNLTEVFGLDNMPGIGISFGLDRIYLALEEKGLFPDNASQKPSYLVANYGADEAVSAMKLIARMRSNGIGCELYPEPAKLKKQFTYAEKKGIENLIFYGSDEIAAGTLSIKNIKTGEQFSTTIDQFLDK